MTDLELITATRAGNGDAFGALAERYRARIFALAYRFTRNAVEADDVVQETFLRAYLHLATFAMQRPFGAWILAIARNVAFDALRRRKRDMSFEHLFEVVPGPEDAVVGRDEAERVRVALAALPERYRRALELHYFEDVRYRDIALALGVPIGTIKTFISRAKRRLYEDLTRAERCTAA
jgi:RNA polymerase sigma-70 factor (ECF subfamily)